MICECAELPWDPVERKAGEVLDEVRYLAIRVRRRQGVLFEDGVLTGLKRIALKPEYLRARPKRLRFQIFCLPGTLVHHARQLRVRVGRLLEQLREWAEAWVLLPATGQREALTDGLSDPFLKSPQPEVRSKVHPGALASGSVNRSAA